MSEGGFNTRVIRCQRDPSNYSHPADMWANQLRHEAKMREIRELDIEEWVWENCDVPGPFAVDWRD